MGSLTNSPIRQGAAGLLAGSRGSLLLNLLGRGGLLLLNLLGQEGLLLKTALGRQQAAQT